MFSMSSSCETNASSVWIGQVGHVAARDDHVADRRGPAEVVEDLLVALGLRKGEPVLLHLRHVVAHQVHAGAVAAVLGTGGEHLRQHLGRVAVGQPLHHPHVRLVEAVAAGARVVRPVGPPVVEGGQHVPADRAVPQVLQVHRVDHLRRDEDRHRRPLALVPLDAGEQGVGDEVAERLLQLAQVLDRVLPLPERALPVRPGRRAVAGDARPVRLAKLTLQRVDEGLWSGGCHGWSSVRRRGGLAARWRGGVEGLHVHVMSGPTTRTCSRVVRRDGRDRPNGQFPVQSADRLSP